MTRLLPILIACALLAGCGGTAGPHMAFGTPQQITVKDSAGVPHLFSYVTFKSGKTIFDHTSAFSIFDENAKHVTTQTTANNGILETLGGQALTTMVPAASALGLVK